MKKLLIVGNHNPKKRWFSSAFYRSVNADNYDYVVRINLAVNYGVWTGTKTNCLAINNYGIPAVEYAYRKILNKAVINDISNVLFCQPKKNKPIKATLGFSSICREDMSSYIVDFQDLRGKVVEFVSEDVFVEMANMVGDDYIPSTGFLVLGYYLNHELFKEFEVSIAGFSWEGWKGHNWDKEKRVMEQFEKNGFIKILKI